MKLRLVPVLFVLALAGCTTTSSGVYQTDRKKSAEANAELGLRYMLQGKNDVAMDKLKRALELDPKCYTAHHYLAELDRRLEQYDDADEHYRGAIDNAPEDANSRIYNNYGAFLCSRKKFDKADRQFQMALKNPVYAGRADVIENMGTCARESGDLAKAEEYFRKALQIDPKRPVSLLAMADIMFRQGNALSARAYLQRFSEVAQANPEYLWLGIRVERVLGDRSAVASYGMLLKNSFPEAEQTRLYLKSQER
jgi:type IV pilus assembly protein PilF